MRSGSTHRLRSWIGRLRRGRSELPGSTRAGGWRGPGERGGAASNRGDRRRSHGATLDRQRSPRPRPGVGESPRGGRTEPASDRLPSCQRAPASRARGRRAASGAVTGAVAGGTPMGRAGDSRPRRGGLVGALSDVAHGTVGQEGRLEPPRPDRVGRAPQPGPGAGHPRSALPASARGTPWDSCDLVRDLRPANAPVNVGRGLHLSPGRPGCAPYSDGAHSRRT